ncbi:AraC family transcriptional regulator [Microbacterium sp. ARD32]|uniref:AraC family transcriptional regulator n=1 Tax=Microbacterium sp. ARD32 TaxID=2962577 RepID=UPI002882B401|nr:AraC family transcriptional regulator [Microbacterium sp. ARD32]MDT0157935.1 AraC family transcriptional regulator [Microbacterium sp. ARD32]
MANDALEHLLDEVAISIRFQHRVIADADQAIALGSDGLSLVYILSGEVALPASGHLPTTLAAGDALLASRRLMLRVPAGSAVLVSELDWADSAAHLAALLPSVGWIRSFDRLEPGAAALAQHMGGDTWVSGERSGDLVICRMMATTVLQSVIRAWSDVGCAPQGWPARSNDPFLNRVVQAIDADPGRDWSVEAMASVSALSRSVFAERFRLAFGVSPAQYVAEVRMRAARALLTDGRGVSEVSRELGYGSDEGFSRAFRRHTGMTPSAFRRRRTPASA